MMKHALVAAVVLVASASVADAQIGFTYEYRGDNWTLRVGGSFGGYSGYGYGGYGSGYGSGYYGGYSPGFVYSGSSGTFAFGTNFLGSNYGWPGTGYGYGSTAVYGDGFSYSSGFVGPRRPYYGSGGYGGGYADYLAMSYTSVRRAQLHGVPEQVQRLTLAKHIETGLKQWKFANYAGALASFKEAVGTDTSSGLAQVYMGLALVATGDPKNAEKALSSGTQTADFASIDLKGMFKDAKEQSKFVGALDKAGPMAGALGYGLLGDRAKAKERAYG